METSLVFVLPISEHRLCPLVVNADAECDDGCSQDFFIPVTAKLPRTPTSSGPRIHWFPFLEGSETESTTQVTKT